MLEYEEVEEEVQAQAPVREDLEVELAEHRACEEEPQVSGEEEASRRRLLLLVLSPFM